MEPYAKRMQPLAKLLRVVAYYNHVGLINSVFLGYIQDCSILGYISD